MKKKIQNRIRLRAPERRLIDQALVARDRAYSSYSGFKVGAALLCRRDKIFIGCNVENASYGATLCAERNAIGRAVVEECVEFEMLAVVTKATPPVAPCGLCLQVLVEFCDDLPILLANPQGEVVRTSLRKLYPEPFNQASLCPSKTR